MSIHIYRATRGKYSKPIPFTESGIKFIDADYKEIPTPFKHACEHSHHWQWGKGTRNGQKLYFPTKKMFVQKWHLTKKELKEAVKYYDMASLEMPTMLICKDCAQFTEQKTNS